VIQQEGEGRAQAARIRAIAEAEAEALRPKAEALLEAWRPYLDLRLLELAPELTREVATALATGRSSTSVPAPIRTMSCASFRPCWRVS
jgi:hypothetical protein